MSKSHRIPPGIVRDFEQAANELRKLIDEARRYEPEAEVYLASGTLCLLSGPSHNRRTHQPQRENVVSSVRIPFMDGGDW